MGERTEIARKIEDGRIVARQGGRKKGTRGKERVRDREKRERERGGQRE